jgi:hypothetical protein
MQLQKEQDLKKMVFAEAEKIESELTIVTQERNQFMNMYNEKCQEVHSLNKKVQEHLIYNGNIENNQ